MGRAPRRLTAGGGLILSLALTLAGCALAPRSDTDVTGGRADTPRTIASPAAGPAAALLAQSRAARTAGDYSGAATTIERALRIEPNDPALWLEYGEIQFALGDFDQALTLARKAAGLAGSEDDTRAAASRLIADATRERSRAAFATEREAERH